MTKHQNWFQSWFDTPYYHILYKQRNNTEAENFIRKLEYGKKRKSEIIF